MRNIERDKAAVSSLRRLGWRVLTIWECNTRKLGGLERSLSPLVKMRELQ
jgi:DNA mismatch endonuclease (patch repair protein)